MFAGRSGRRSGWRGPELRDADYLIDRECHHAEHEVAFDLDRAAHAHRPLHLEIGDAGAGHGHQGNGDLTVVDGSRSHKTKRVLDEQNANGDNGAEPDIITKSMRPDDVSDEAVCDLLATMEDAQWRAMSL